MWGIVVCPEFEIRGASRVRGAAGCEGILQTGIAMRDMELRSGRWSALVRVVWVFVVTGALLGVLAGCRTSASAHARKGDKAVRQGRSGPSHAEDRGSARAAARAAVADEDEDDDDDDDEARVAKHEAKRGRQGGDKDEDDDDDDDDGRAMKGGKRGSGREDEDDDDDERVDKSGERGGKAQDEDDDDDDDDEDDEARAGQEAPRHANERGSARESSPRAAATSRRAAERGRIDSARGGGMRSVSFVHDIQPILKESCVSCHRPGKAKGRLDLTTWESFHAGGKKHRPAFVPGQPERSAVVRMISGPDPSMPGKGDPLTRQEVALIARWVREGARDDSRNASPSRRF